MAEYRQIRIKIHEFAGGGGTHQALDGIELD
jgi:hypothetical protein